VNPQRGNKYVNTATSGLQHAEIITEVTLFLQNKLFDELCLISVFFHERLMLYSQSTNDSAKYLCILCKFADTK